MNKNIRYSVHRSSFVDFFAIVVPRKDNVVVGARVTYEIVETRVFGYTTAFVSKLLIKKSRCPLTPVRVFGIDLFLVFNHRQQRVVVTAQQHDNVAELHFVYRTRCHATIAADSIDSELSNRCERTPQFSSE